MSDFVTIQVKAKGGVGHSLHKTTRVLRAQRNIKPGYFFNLDF